MDRLEEVCLAVHTQRNYKIPHPHALTCCFCVLYTKSQNNMLKICFAQVGKQLKSIFPTDK